MKNDAPAEAALLYEIALANLHEYAFFVMDTHGVIQTWHPGVEAVFGYSRDAFLGYSGLMIFTEEQRRTGVPEYEMRMAAETGRANDERWHVRSDGTHFWAVGIMSALRDSRGKLLGFAKIVRDNTDKKRADDALAHLNDTLTQQVEARAQQLRNLASELTLAEERERRRLAQLVHDDLQQQLFALQMVLRKPKAGLEATLEPALEIITDALHITRSLSVEISPPALQEGFTAGLRWLREHMAMRYSLNIDLNLPDEDPVLSEPVKLLLFQIARELLFNIVKHAGIQEATVELHDAANELRLEIVDQGDGFDGEVQGGGFGLGSVRQRLELYGGRLEVVSALGSGTRATIRLPHQNRTE